MNSINVVAVLAAGMAWLSPAGGAMAQPPPAAAQSQRTGMPPTDVAPVNGGTQADSPATEVLHVSSIEIIRSAHAPALDIIRARGVVSSAGWEEAELVPLTRGVPADGILQLILVARPPEAAADATGYETIEAIFPLETDHPFKGVTVHAATNAVSVAALPGYAESKSALDDCGKCVGKTFVAKGGSATGRTDVVREEQLPPDTRVVRPSDGMRGGASNPNRLTLIVDKDNRIVAAVWE
jgi:hypothetical protein